MNRDSAQFGFKAQGPRLEGRVDLVSPRVLCSQESGEFLNLQVQGSASMPTSIKRMDGSVTQFVKVKAVHPGARMGRADTLDSELIAPPKDNILEMISESIVRGDDIQVYRIDEQTIQIYLKNSSEVRGVRIATRVLATYRFRNTSVGVPVPVPAPAPVPAPVIQPQSRCGVNGSYITMDGENAFHFYGESERMEQYLKLLRSGVCSADNKLGARDSYITLNRVNAFYIYSNANRLQELIRLHEAGVGTNLGQCRVQDKYITLRGQNAFYVYGESDRMEKLINLINAGACS